MRMTTVRLSESLHRDLQRAAEASGISVAQYLREAAIAWMNWERGVEYGRALAESVEHQEQVEDRDRRAGGE